MLILLLPFLVVTSSHLDSIHQRTSLLPALSTVPLLFLSFELTGVLQPENPLPTHVLQEFANKIPTLHFLQVPARDPPLFGGTDYWQIMRSETEGAQLDSLSSAAGRDISRRLSQLDRDALLHFDIERFMARK